MYKMVVHAHMHVQRRLSKSTKRVLLRHTYVEVGAEGRGG